AEPNAWSRVRRASAAVIEGATPKSMSATHAGTTSGGNLCHLLVRRARNLAMSKSVASVVLMRLLSTPAAPSAARISGLIARQRRPHHIRNSIVEDRSLHRDTSGSKDCAGLKRTRQRRMEALERRVTGRCPAWHSGRLHFRRKR